MESEEFQGVLDLCKRARDYATALGLVHYDRGKSRIKFHDQDVRALYIQIVNIAKDLSKSVAKAELKEARSSLDFTTTNTHQLIDSFSQIWGANNRDPLIDTLYATEVQRALYPRDLYIEQPEHYERIMILLHCWVINCALGKPTAAQAVSATFNDESRGRNSDQQIVVQALYPPSTTRLDMTSYKTAVQPDGPLLHNGLSDQGAFQAPTARMAHVSPTQPSPARKAPPSSYNTRSKSKPNARDILGYEDVDEEEISHHDQPESPIESENDDDCDSVIGATRTRDGGRKRSRDSERDTRDGHCKRNKMVVVFKLPIETLPGVREEHRDDVLQPDTPLGVEAYVGQPSTSGRRPDHRTSPTRSTSPTATVASDQQTTSFIDQQDHDPAGSPPAVSQVSEMELERVRFQLSQALQAINRSPHPDIHSFKILDALIGNNTRDLENAVREKLQGRYAVLRSAYTRWRTFHNRLGDFWSRIEFNGGTREEYKAYKSELSKPDRLRLDIFAAAQDLKDWQRKKKEDRQWMRVDTFDQELANFFFELFEDDNWSPEDLQIHLEGYNRELLSWFI